MLLLTIGQQQPKLAVGGPTWADQGARLDVLMAAGYSPDALRTAVTANLPQAINNAGGFVSRRIDRIPAAPAILPRQADPESAGWDSAWSESTDTLQPTLASADRSVAEALNRRVSHECEQCGRPGVPAGFALCEVCLDWPVCTACTSLTPRRANPAGSGRCGPCETAWTSGPTDDEWEQSVQLAALEVAKMEAQEATAPF